DPPGAIIDAGTVVTLTAAANPGFQFIGWRGDLGGSANPESIAITRDTNVTAIFQPLFVLHAFVRSGDGSIIVSPEQPAYPAGQPISLTASPLPGWKFDGWHGEIETDQNPLIISLDRNL